MMNLFTSAITVAQPSRIVCFIASIVFASSAAAATAAQCQAVSASRQTTLVELYTSEGCNSCPPADRWLSSLKGRDDVLAAAFHVDYWDRLGWKDRFARPEFTARQAEGQARAGARFSYTPQVLVNGRDWRRWPGLPAGEKSAAVHIALQRDSHAGVQVRVTARAGAPGRLGLWWAVLEDDHVSAVKAGENTGVTLHHDHVVRAHGRRDSWPADDRSAWRLEVPTAADGARPSRLLVVVTEAATGVPLQVVQLTC